MEYRTTRRSGIEPPFDDAVEVKMGVEQCAETVDEDDGAEAGFRTGARTALAQASLDRAQEEAQRGILNRQVAL